MTSDGLMGKYWHIGRVTPESGNVVGGGSQQCQQHPKPSKHWSTVSKQILCFSNYPKIPRLSS